MNYKLFNRHDCFTPEMMEMTREVIEEAQGKDFGLVNMVYGLYDGYLYDDLLKQARIAGINELTMNKLKGLKKAIEMYIQLTGNLKTQI